MEKKETDKKEQILSVAEDLFSEYGYAATSTRMLAKEANCNLGMLTYYFGSKQKILEAIMDKKIGFYRTNFEKIRQNASSCMQMMESIIDIYVDHMIANRKFQKIMHSEIFNSSNIDLQDYKLQLVEKNIAYICTIIEEGIEKKEFRKIDGRMFMGSIIGTLLIYIKSDFFTSKFLKIDENESIDSIYAKEKIRMYLKDYLHSFLKINQ